MSATIDTVAVATTLRDAALNGQRDAWRALYDSAHDAMTRYVHWRCQNLRDLADDCLQDTWLTAAKSLSQFDPQRGSFTAWMCGIAGNVIRKRLQSYRRLAVKQMALTGQETQAEAEDRGEQSLKIVKALAGLALDYECVLREKYWEGLTVAEMALRHGQSEKAIESRLTRARQAFREAYA